MSSKRAKARAAYHPVPYEDADTAAIQALAAGVANSGQQQRALRWIVETVCATYDLPYRPGGDEGRRDTDFALGRAFCGQQIVKQTKIPLSAQQRDR